MNIKQKIISLINQIPICLYIIIIFSFVNLYSQNKVVTTKRGNTSENILSNRSMLTLEGIITSGYTDYDANPGGGFKGIYEHYFKANRSSVFGFNIEASGQNLFGNDLSKNPDGFKTDIISIGPNAVYSFGFSRYVLSYFTGGLSAVWFNPMIQGGAKSPNNSRDVYENITISYNFGGGFKIPLSNVIFINLGAGLHYIPNDNLDDLAAGKFNDYYLTGSAGLSISLSSNRDNDKDGIDNSKDRCPNQPEDLDGFQDEDGCPDFDNDDDSVVDIRDKCPNQHEDFDGFEDEDGCPETDNDQDGIADANDKCPDISEDMDTFEDEDGCPDLDNDNDGLVDTRDGCLNQSEDFDGFKDEDGCPDIDNDQDGIVDAKDRCLNAAEDLDGFQDADGCPDPDNDRDGIVDVRDKCPNQAENVNGISDGDGCPEKESTTAATTTANESPNFRTNIETENTDTQKETRVPPSNVSVQMDVTFAKDNSSIRPEAKNILSRITSYIKKYPNTKWKIEVHVDEGNTSSQMQSLSRQRAQALINYFSSNGLSPSNFSVVFMGDKYPIERNASAYGRMKNRRIDLKRAK